MENQAAPLLCLNRLRKFDQSQENDGSHAAINLERVVPADLRSAAALLRYYLLRRNVDVVVAQLASSAAGTRRRKRRCARLSGEPSSQGAPPPIL